MTLNSRWSRISSRAGSYKEVILPLTSRKVAVTSESLLQFQSFGSSRTIVDDFQRPAAHLLQTVTAENDPDQLVKLDFLISPRALLLASHRCNMIKLIFQGPFHRLHTVTSSPLFRTVWKDCAKWRIGRQWWSLPMLSRFPNDFHIVKSVTGLTIYPWVHNDTKLFRLLADQSRCHVSNISESFPVTQSLTSLTWIINSFFVS